MGFPDPEALREFIVDTPWGVNNRRPVVYLRHLSAQGEPFQLRSFLRRFLLAGFAVRVERRLLGFEGSNSTHRSPAPQVRIRKETQGNGLKTRI